MKCQYDAFCWMLMFCRDSVNSLSEGSEKVGDRKKTTPYLSKVVNEEERLQHGVHMTCSTLVFQSNISNFLL